MPKTPYGIIVLPSVSKDIRRLPAVILRRIRTAISLLPNDPIPPSAQPLQGYPGYFRIRVGPYRILYEVAHAIRIITIARVGHRKDVYRKM